MSATLTEAYADVYGRLEESQAARDRCRTALANCYISVSLVLESKRFDLSPEVRKVLSKAAAAARGELEESKR